MTTTIIIASRGHRSNISKVNSSTPIYILRIIIQYDGIIMIMYCKNGFEIVLFMNLDPFTFQIIKNDTNCLTAWHAVIRVRIC